MTEHLVGSSYERKTVKLPNPHVGKPKANNLRKQAPAVEVDNAMPAGLAHRRFPDQPGQARNKKRAKMAKRAQEKPDLTKQFRPNLGNPFV
jgi:hypothetical protein